MDKKPQRNTDIVWRKFKENLLLDTGHAMNEIGMEIWKLCDGKHTIKEIIDNVFEKFETDRKTVENDIISFIKELEKEKMIKLE